MSKKEIYPLKFNEIFKEKIWGGRRLESFFKKRLPEDKFIGESWELVDHGEDISVVRNGKYRGDNLKNLIKNFEKELVGKDIKLSRGNRFPLLFKFIDASKKLSIQVHPDDEYAYLNEIDETGKTEAWYVVWAKPGAQLVCGLKKHMSRRKFKKVIESKKIGEYLNYINVYNGDLIFIPPGTIHTIMGGVLLAEIQQNSDATYRISDWDRVDRYGKSRELHIDKALDVIDFSLVRNYKIQPLSINIDRNVIKYLIACEKFAVELCEIFDEYKLDCDGSKFYMLSFLEGNGQIFYGNESDINLNTKTLDIKKGETILLPALLGKTTIKTDSKLRDDKLKFLKFYVPNIIKDIIKPLTDKGFTKQDIIRLGGWNKVNDIMKYF
ncbi:MAG: mannose-6-phosphate isomerase, class I [Actinobacteria bacterium]|nr:mannose-6-phosphate isomerase, class I [Actinomycetota bacterium]